MARWFEQAVKIRTSINTILNLINVIYSLQHFSSSKGGNKAHSIDLERLLQLNLHKTPMFAVFALCSEREAHH